MRYRTIVADPPWDYADGFFSMWPATQSRGGEKAKRPLPYASLSISDICALPVASFAEPSAFLFLWTTNRYLREAFTVLDAWGFKYAQTLVWHKTNPAPFAGSVAPNSAEYLLVAKRGTIKRAGFAKSAVITARRPKGSGFSYAREDHSAKPEAFLDLVEQVSPGPYLEMFAQRARFGWDYWGDESLSTVEMPA